MTSLFFLKVAWPLQALVIFSILALRAFLLAGGSTVWTALSKWARSRRILIGELRFKTYLSEIGHGMKILVLDALGVTILLRAGVFRFEKLESASQFLIPFLLLFIWVEIYFYYTHRIFHHPRFFWIHRHHHQHAPLNPWSSLSFSLAERLVLLPGVSLVPALMSRVWPFPIECYLAYFSVNYILNVFAHLNHEMIPSSFTGTWVGKVLNTSTYHALHHLRYKGHFGLFTSTLDRLHGTNFTDYQERQKESFHGKPAGLL